MTGRAIFSEWLERLNQLTQRLGVAGELEHWDHDLTMLMLEASNWKEEHKAELDEEDRRVLEGLERSFADMQVCRVVSPWMGSLVLELADFSRRHPQFRVVIILEGRGERGDVVVRLHDRADGKHRFGVSADRHEEVVPTLEGFAKGVIIL